jgi:hypothetical protein
VNRIPVHLLITSAIGESWYQNNPEIFLIATDIGWGDKRLRHSVSYIRLSGQSRDFSYGTRKSEKFLPCFLIRVVVQFPKIIRDGAKCGHLSDFPIDRALMEP